MRLRVWLVASVFMLSLVAIPSPAKADYVFTPFLGINLGGDAPRKPFTFGGGVTLVGRSIALELEGARTHDFFSDGSTSVSLLTAALVGGADLPGTGVKPYFLTGAGLLRTNVDFTDVLNDTSYNNFALLLGGGLNVYVTDHIGIRGDVRYYRRLERPSNIAAIPIASNFDFFRATVGVNIRFF